MILKGEFMKNLLVGLLMTVAGTSFAATQSKCSIDTHLRLYPAIFSTDVRVERSDKNVVECVVEAVSLSEKNETVKAIVADDELNIKGKFQIRTNSVLPALHEACRIDTFIKLQPAILSSWVKAERSDLNALECLAKAYDLADKNDKINIKINDQELNLKGNFKIRK